MNYFEGVIVNVGPRSFPVKTMHPDVGDQLDAVGYCRGTPADWIEVVDGLAPGRALSVLWHEITHAFDFETNIVNLLRTAARSEITDKAFAELVCDSVGTLVASALVCSPTLPPKLWKACAAAVVERTGSGGISDCPECNLMPKE